MVGSVGQGGQGLPTAGAIAGAGFPLQAWDRRPASVESLPCVPRRVVDTVARPALIRRPNGHPACGDGPGHRLSHDLGDSRAGRVAGRFRGGSARPHRTPTAPAA